MRYMAKFVKLTHKKFGVSVGTHKFNLGNCLKDYDEIWYWDSTLKFGRPLQVWFILIQ
jgi:hypothetical protein